MKKICISILTVCLFSACTSVKIHSWADPEFGQRRLGKTMVLAIANSDSVSRQYETLFVDRLTEVGVEARSLHALLQKSDPVSEEALAAALKERNFDSILVTRKLSETEREQTVTMGRYPAYYGNYFGYYSHAYAINYSTTTYVQNFMEFELETNLYDVKTRKLVWTGRCTVYDDRSDKTNMKGIIKGVINDLGKKGLL